MAGNAGCPRLGSNSLSLAFRSIFCRRARKRARVIDVAAPAFRNEQDCQIWNSKDREIGTIELG
jgi:hypothetical protein